MTLRGLLGAALGGLFGVLLGFASPAVAQGVTTQCIVNVAAQGSSDAITSAQLPCGTTTTLVLLTVAAANTTTAPTYAPVGSPPLPIVSSGGGIIAVGTLQPNYIAMLSGTGTSWALLNPPGFQNPAVLAGAAPALFIGPATDWLGSNPYSGGKYGYGNNLDLVVESNSHFKGATFASRTSDGPGQTFGTINWCFNDYTGASVTCWANYNEARRFTGAGPAQNAEWDITEFGTSDPFDPFNRQYGGLAYSAGLRLASGGACTAGTPCFDPATGLYDAIAQSAGAAMVITNNGANYLTVMDVGYNAVAGSDGISAAGQFAPILKMAPGHAIVWDVCSDTSTVPTSCAINNHSGWIIDRQNVVGGAGPHEIFAFENTNVNGNVSVENNTGNALFSVGFNATDTQGWEVNASSTGSPTLMVIGPGADINGHIKAKGAGLLYQDSPMVLTAAAPTVAASQIGYGSTVAAAANCNVASPTPTGCIVVNVAGTVRYVPYY